MIKILIVLALINSKEKNMFNNRIKGCMFILLLFVLITAVNATDSTNQSVDTITTQTTEPLETNSVPCDVNTNTEVQINHDSKTIQSNEDSVNSIQKINKNSEKTSESKVFKVTEDNLSKYINYNGINTTVVSEGSQLEFEGEFNDLFIFVDIPVNITKGSTPANFINSYIYVVTDNVNITGITMKSSYSEDESLITLDEASNVRIENNDLTLENYDFFQTHTIDITGGSNIVIKNNSITTIGPEDIIDFSDKGKCTTVSINTLETVNITIDGNIITTRNNGVNQKPVGTIYSIYLRGENVISRTQKAQITNNNIFTEGEQYIYGITVFYEDDMLIENNTIQTKSMEYANGLQLEVIHDSIINNNNITCIAGNYTYPIYLSGQEAGETYYSENNTVSNNTATGDSMICYLIELFLTKNHTISNNNLTADVNYGLGVATSQVSNSIIEYNNINISNTMVGSLPNPDAISNDPAGVKITVLKSKEELGINNTIRNNTIFMSTQEGQSVPAVDLYSINNSVYNNYLVSTLGEGDNAVKSVEGNDIHDNLPSNIHKTKTKIVLDEIDPVIKGEPIIISGKLTDINGQIIPGVAVKILINDSPKTIRTGNYGDFDHIYVMNKVGTNNITVSFNGNDDYEACELTTTVEVNKVQTHVKVDDIQSIIKGNTVVITGKVTDENGNKIVGGAVKILINGSPKTVRTDSNGVFTHSYVMNKVGINNITVIYNGNNYYAASNVSITVNVTKTESKIVLNDISPVNKGSNVTITGKVVDVNGNALSGVQVKIMINGSSKTLRTDSNGVFTHYYIMSKVGINNITAIFKGNNDFDTAQTNTTVEVIKT